MEQKGFRGRNALSRAILNASNEDLSAFAEEFTRTLEYESDLVELVEEALIETAECLQPVAAAARGVWTTNSGLWVYPAEETTDGLLLPPLYAVAHSMCLEARERKSEPQLLDYIDPEERLYVEACMLSSRAACDAWLECFLVQNADDPQSGATHCLTPDGWVAVTWKKDVTSAYMIVDRANPGFPLVKLAIATKVPPASTREDHLSCQQFS